MTVEGFLVQKYGHSKIGFEVEYHVSVEELEDF